jgi:short-subunit dehydrogenase
MEFRERYGPWAVIAGASMGIGAALSHEAARRGVNVVMMARGEEQLRAKAAEVAQAHGVEARPLVADLGDPAIGDVVRDAVDGLEVGLFVHNATVAIPGRFLDVPLDDDLLSVRVNCDSVLALTKVLGAPMRDRGRGAIALVSSMGGTAGATNFGSYNATKAFQWILAETLWAELGEHGVDALTIIVGATTSDNFLAFQATLDPELCGRADSPDPLDRARNRLVNASTPEDVATALYDQLGDGPVVFAHPDDAYVARATWALPRADAVAVWRGVQETSTRTPDRIAR